MGGLFSSSPYDAALPPRRRGGRAGPYEPLFFPDAGLPCRNYLAGRECRWGANCRYVHEETNLTRILAVLAGARHTIDAAVFNITSRELADALVAARRRGVAVRVITDDQEARDGGSLVERLRTAGAQVETDDSRRLHMHHKFAVVDAEVLLSGSFNWTRRAVESANENVVIGFDPALAGSFAKEFGRLWAAFGRHDAGEAESAAPGRRDVTALFFPDASGTNVDVILGEILAARRSIHVAMFTLTLDKLADALLEKHRHGVEVRVITDYRQSSTPGADARRLLKAGLPLHIAPSGHTMHHKFAIVDSSVVVNGSFNWTAQAAHGNQEDAVVYRCSRLAASFESEFDRLWKRLGDESGRAS